MQKFGKKLVSNSVFRFLDWIFITLPSFVYWVIAGKNLSRLQLGIVSTSVNFSMMLSGIALLGLNTTLWKLLPEYLEKKQKTKANELVLFSLKLVLISNTVFILGLLISSTFLSQILKIPIEVIFITAINLVLLSLWVMFEAILVGKQQMKKIATTDLIGQSIKVVTTAILIFLGLSYFGPLIGFSIGIMAIILLRIPFDFFGRIKTKTLDKRKIFLDFSLPAFISTLALIIFLNGQYVLLTAIKNPEATGIFTIAMLITSPIITIPTVLSSALFPIVSQLSVRQNPEGKQKYLMNLVFRYALFISVPIAIFLVIFSNHIILTFWNQQYLSSSSLLPVLALASLIYGSGIVFNQNLYSLGKPKTQRNIILTSVFLFFILAVPLTLIYSTFGMCFSYLIAISFLSVASYINVKKVLRMSLPWKDVKKILFAGILSLSFLYIISSLIPDIYIAIVSCLITGIIYLGILLLLKFFNKQDMKLFRLITERSPIFKKQLLRISEFLLKYI